MNIPKYDFHVHYKVHAQDTNGHEEAMVQRAIEVGLAGICFTEHSQQLPDARIRDLRATYPQIKIWSGMEIATIEGNDLLVFSMRGTPPTKPTWEWLYGYCKMYGYATCLAHPFRKDRPVPKVFRNLPPDYVELVSRNTPTWAAPYIIKEFTKRHMVCGEIASENLMVDGFLVNSDSHKPRHLGWHFNYRSETAEKLAQLLERQTLASLPAPYLSYLSKFS